jgi:hypothetical protein
MSNSANFEEGIGAGFIAGLVLSMIMLMKQAMGVASVEFNRDDHSYGGGQHATSGWIGALHRDDTLGVIYAWLDPKLPGPIGCVEQFLPPAPGSSLWWCLCRWRVLGFSECSSV